MKFAIDAHAIGQKLTGNETYIRNLLKGFAALDQESEFLALVSVDEAIPHIPKGFQVGRVSTNPYLRLGWQIHAQMQSWQPDVLHVQYTAPLQAKVPVVVSVHDVSYLESPEFFSRYRSTQLKITVKRTVEKAAHIMTPSEFSRQAVAKWYGMDPARITVVHNAVDETFRPVSREVAAAWLLRHKGVAWPYVLTVGDLQPRKNHIGLIKAFESVMREHPQLTHRLVITGKDTWFSSQVRAAAQASSVADRIVFTGFVNDEELHHYYSGCEVFVYPSFYEGFGLPILEAMACGRAVCCSDTSAMPEVADSAALLFDPSQTDQIALAMRDLLIDAQLRARMERLGNQRAALFSWERASRRTLDVYYSVAEGRRKAEHVRAVSAARR
jgi:glycosyltransferase involved in cell wall biosynthesis